MKSSKANWKLKLGGKNARELNGKYRNISHHLQIHRFFWIWIDFWRCLTFKFWNKILLQFIHQLRNNAMFFMTGNLFSILQNIFYFIFSCEDQFMSYRIHLQFTIYTHTRSHILQAVFTFGCDTYVWCVCSAFHRKGQKYDWKFFWNESKSV